MTNSIPLAMLVPSAPLSLPPPDDDHLVETIISDTAADLRELVDFERRRHSFLTHSLGRIYERACIIDARPACRDILIRRLRKTLGVGKCLRWGIAGRATHELLLKAAAPNMIKETKYQHHRKLTKAIEADVAPSEEAYVAWVESEKANRQKKKESQPPPNDENETQDNGEPSDPDQPTGSDDTTANEETSKIRFQRALDEFAWTVPQPGEEDPILRISTPHREKFPEEIGIMIFRTADGTQAGLVRDVHQLGLVTGYDGVADALLACLKEGQQYQRDQRRLHGRRIDAFFQKIKAHRMRAEDWAEPEPEPAPFTQEQIDAASNDDERIWMEVLNEDHAQGKGGIARLPQMSKRKPPRTPISALRKR